MTPVGGPCFRTCGREGRAWGTGEAAEQLRPSVAQGHHPLPCPPKQRDPLLSAHQSPQGSVQASLLCYQSSFASLCLFSLMSSI